VSQFTFDTSLVGANRLVLLADFEGGEFMACTITSRIAFAAFGILAVGFATLPRFSTRLREAVSRDAR
jgi:hypothetical protein